MKDIKITVRRQKTELKTFFVCFLVAFCLNVYAIIAYDGKWKELFFSLGYVVASAVTLYVLWTIVRLCAYMIRSTLRKS